MQDVRAYRGNAGAEVADDAFDISRAADRPDRRWVYARYTKRLCDLCIVALAAPAAVALVAGCAALVMLDGHRPFYSQLRVGRNGRSFRMWKLRSMVPGAEAILEAHLSRSPIARQEWAEKQKLVEDPRITPVGRILRRTSLDELPQLFNVLRGDMSLVGPRPILLEQRALYSGRHYYRLRPGLTGPWQVSERNAAAFHERVRYDEQYFRTVSLRTDAKILLRTVDVVLRSTGQ